MKGMKKGIVHREKNSWVQRTIFRKIENIWKIVYVVFSHNWFCEHPVDPLVVVPFSGDPDCLT